VKAFERGLDVLHLSRPGVPNLEELSEKLHARTGWQVVGVPGIVPDDVFFRHLSQRRFPAAVFIRAADQLDYLEEPDMFHDLFGHVPLLADPAVADVLQALGHLGLEAIANGSLHRLSRLYWYSVEFGLAREDNQLRIYGAGILSSFSEVHYSLESPKPRRLKFDLKSVLRSRYDIDAFQQLYFVIDRFEDLLTLMQGQDVPAICAALDALEDLDPTSVEGEAIDLPLRR
jgi:phenylalanine-4-hydroxylase